MSDDRIIDFNDLKNKVKDSDVDKFEQYIYNLYFSVMDGSMTMAEFSRKIFDYMKDNNISQEKFMNIQKKFMERYGMDSDEVERQLKNFGIDPSIAGMNNIDLNNISSENLESIKKSAPVTEALFNQKKSRRSEYILRLAERIARERITIIQSGFSRFAEFLPVAAFRSRKKARFVPPQGSPPTPDGCRGSQRRRIPAPLPAAPDTPTAFPAWSGGR